MDDSPKVLVSVLSNQDVSGKNPQLVVRCEGSTLDIYVDTRWALRPEDGNRRTVRYRFDGERPLQARLLSSGNQQAVFFDRPQVVAKKLAGARALALEYQSLTWGEQTVTFPVSGFDSRAVQRCLAH